MRHYCVGCNRERSFRFVREFRDDLGRLVEVYVCEYCGSEKSVVVG